MRPQGAPHPSRGAARHEPGRRRVAVSAQLLGRSDTDALRAADVAELLSAAVTPSAWARRFSIVRRVSQQAKAAAVRAQAVGHTGGHQAAVGWVTASTAVRVMAKACAQQRS
ncbi:hypothetical protein HY68_28025 [Streptomyces sp. AcH 505]|nr:hypothetical protein HY68_28025 [Streptomyces sp. AcH 505]